MSVQIVTDDLKRELYRVDGAIQATPAQMRRALGKAIIEVEREAKRYARSGGAFSRRSKGLLARSLGSKMDGDSAATLTVGVAYGLIQDRGGVTPAHPIPLRFAKAFRFMGRGGQFVIRAGSKGTPGVINHPGSRIPPKHYARQAFESAKPQVEWVLKNAAKETIGGKA